MSSPSSAAMSYVTTWMGDRLSFRPGMGCNLAGNLFLSPDFHKF